MDSSPVLRQQSHNKIRSDVMRMKNENNKMPAHTKSSKLLSAPKFPVLDVENHDPGNAHMGRKAPAGKPGVSRLPVLAKSLHLQTSSDFSQSHCRWEEKPLTGKAKKKKPCTRPIPFNFSQPKTSKTVRESTENQQPLTVSHSSTGNARLKTQNISAKPTKHSATLSRKVDSAVATGKSKTIHNSATHQNSTTSSAQPAPSEENCLDNMNMLSLSDPTKTSSAIQNMQPITQGNFTKSAIDKGENFQSDHAALLSILRNEGVSAAGLGSATPLSKSYNYLPQRVSVMKSRQKVGPTAALLAGSKSVHFSPDAAALNSILQNEGVRALGTTPGKSIRPSGRGTSIFTAQRVPVRKNRAEVAGGPVVALRETPQNKWTPQRVRDTRHQPMSAMKWHMSTPGLQICKTKDPLCQEEVVQRLFDDQEDEQNMNVSDKDPETQEKQLATPSKSTEEEAEETRDQGEDEKEERILGAHPFIQSLQRESVIFFSTGKTLQRVARFKQQESSEQHEPHGLVSSQQRKVTPEHEDTSSERGTTCPINASVQSQHKVPDLFARKTCAPSPAVALLRKRLPNLEELHMDAEVATYTSMSVPATPGFLPPRPRCGNPLASTLHFEESTRFVPISCDSWSDSSSPQSSPLQER